MVNHNRTCRPRRCHRSCDGSKTVLPIVMWMLMMLVLSPFDAPMSGNRLVVQAVDITSASSTSTSTSTGSRGIIVRVRLVDGSIEKIQLPHAGAEQTTSLVDILGTMEVPVGSSIQVGPAPGSAGRTGRSTTGVVATPTSNAGDGKRIVPTDDKSYMMTSLSDLGVQHGSIITIQPPAGTGPLSSSSSSANGITKSTTVPSWDPYPDLAKSADYFGAIRRAKTKRSGQRVMSYGDVARIQSSLHTVEPQMDGPLKRIYMCKVCAERFCANCMDSSKRKKNKSKTNDDVSSTTSYNCRVGLLFGTIQKERTDIHRPKKARTSLSSTTSDTEYCTVAKVQAVWEPPAQPSSSSSSSSSPLYDVPIARGLLKDHPRVLMIANYLGLVPVGWIFSYNDGRSNQSDDDSLPVWGLDVATGAELQIDNMRQKQQEQKQQHHERDNKDVRPADDDLGNKFVTLAMDAKTGSTEAFQLSDVSVQMVHEGMFMLHQNDDDSRDTKMGPSSSHTNVDNHNPRIVPVKRTILVDGQETVELDSVLCLVNTAMLSHVGSYSGTVPTPSAIKKLNGSLTSAARKKLLETIKSSDNDQGLLRELCDFNILLALDQLLTPDEIKDLCLSVRKWARGQKLGTKVDSTVKMKLQGILET